jgi:peptidoglycan/LPS O-acetylase OafA/YrhL
VSGGGYGRCPQSLGEVTTVGIDTGTTVVSPAPVPPAAGQDRSVAPGAAAAVVFPGFDGLRAIAALLVIVVHTAFQSGLTTGSSLGRYSARGEIGVAVFFLISGFLLYRPFAAAHLAGRPGPDAGGFLIRRFLRIVPLYWVALAVSLNVVGNDRIYLHGLAGIAQTAFFLQGYRQQWAIQGLTQAWTLDVEIVFYLSLPLFAGLLARRPRSPRAQVRVELAALAGLFTVGKLIHWVLIPVNSGWMDGWSVWLPVWWDLFSMGMVLAVLSAWYVQVGRQPRWAQLPGSGTACWLVAAFFYWLSSTRIGLPLSPIFDPTVKQDMLRHLCYSLFGFFLLLPAVFGRQDRGWVRPFLASRPMAFLGLISYGLYLWHATVIDLVMEHSGWTLWHIPFLPFFLAVLSLTAALSTVTYMLVERPCIGLGRDWARRLRMRSAGAAGAAAPVVSQPTAAEAVPGLGGAAHASPVPQIATTATTGGVRRSAGGPDPEPSRHGLPLTTPEGDP